MYDTQEWYDKSSIAEGQRLGWEGGGRGGKSINGATMQKGKRVMGWMVLAVANMVQEKMGSDTTGEYKKRA